MANPRVKICGITTVDDAIFAAEAGADAIGLVFYAKSPRAVTVKEARSIALAVGPFVTVTALFVDAGSDEVNQVLSEVPIQLLQFHGIETPEYCCSFKRPYMKALRMKPDIAVDNEITRFTGASGILLDAYRPGVPGGTGEIFDWRRVPVDANVPIILAGGLNVENVAEAIKTANVNGVDVSGGVESAPGKKDHSKIRAFIEATRLRI